MTLKWLTIGLKQPRIPEFYTLTKIHKKTPVGRPTERISSFVDSLLQPIAIKQEFYMKDTTDFINFIENTQIPDNVALATLDVSSVYTNIPQEEGIDVVCRFYEDHYEQKLPIPTNDLRELMRLILEENSFKFNEKHFVQTHGIAMGTKMAVAFSVIFMADLEKRLLAASPLKPFVWKRFIDDIFSLWNIPMEEVSIFVDFANSFHPKIKFTCEMSSERAVFLDTEVFKGPRLSSLGILDSQTHFKPTETFQYTHFSFCHPFNTKKGFIKGEALRLLRTNSIKENFYKHKRDFEQRLCDRGYPAALVHKILTEVQFSDRTEALRNKTKNAKEILPFVTTYNPATPNLKKILMKNWHIIQQQPRLAHIFKQPPIVSCREEKSLKDFLVRAKLPSITPQS